MTDQTREIPVRVAILVTRMDIGGVPDHIMTLLEGFDTSVQVVLITNHVHPDHQARIAELGIRVILFPMNRLLSPLSDVGAVRKLRKIIRDENIDILHTHTSKPALLGSMVGFTTRKIIVVNTAHNFGFIAIPSRWKRSVFWVYDWLIAKLGFDATVTVSQKVGDAVVQSKLIPKNRVHVIPNGIRDKLISSAGLELNDEARAQLRSQLLVEPDHVLILCVARLVWFKGLDTLLVAFQSVLKTNAEARLVIVGDGELRDELSSQAEELGVVHAVNFCGERRDVPHILNVSNMFVLSSVSEGLPISILEAMAARLPTIATDVGGTSELVVDGETGRLVPSKNAEKLAEAMSELVQNPDTRNKFGAAGYARLVNNFSQDAMVRQTQSLYRELMNRSEARASNA